MALLVRMTHRHHFLQLLLLAALRLNHCTRIQEGHDTAQALLLCMETLLMLHRHSLSQAERETYLDILVAFPVPFPALLRHLPVYLDLLLSLLESSPRQQEMGLQQLLRLAQSADHGLLVDALAETTTKERLHAALDAILFGPSRQALLDGVLQLLGCLGGALRSELAMPLCTNVKQETVRGLSSACTSSTSMALVKRLSVKRPTQSSGK